MPSIPPSGTPDNNSGLGSGQPQSGGLQTPRDTSSPAASADQAATQATFNEAGVRSAQANWLDGLNRLLYAPGTGYLNQQGAAAVGGYGPAQQAMGKLYQQAQDNLADDHQRAIFTQATAPIINAAQARIQQHAQAQSRVYDADASRARAQAARDLAVNAWNPAPGADNSNYRQGAAILHNELENQFRHTWGDPASAGNHTLWNHFLQHGPNGDDGIASLSTGVVNRLLANDQPSDAQTFLDQVQHTLPAPTRDKLTQFVTAGLDQHAGISAALKAQAAGNDPAAQQQKLDALHSDGHISDQAHAIATHKIQADQAAQAAARQQNDTQTLQKVWALKNANPNAALTDLGSADYAYLKSRGLDANALAILQSHPATDDPGLFNQLHSLANQDPVQFGKQNLLAESGKLSRAHMQTLLSLQDAVNKQDPQAIRAGKQGEEGRGPADGARRDVGGDHNPAPDSKSANTRTALESTLRDRLIAAQQANKGAPLADDDAQRIARRYLADQVASGALRFVSPEVMAAFSGDEAGHPIPEQDRKQLARALARAGVVPGEYNIRLAYQHLKGEH